MGVEPTSPAWKAGVIAVIRRPLDFLIFSKIQGFVNGRYGNQFSDYYIEAIVRYLVYLVFHRAFENSFKK